MSNSNDNPLPQHLGDWMSCLRRASLARVILHEFEGGRATGEVQWRDASGSHRRSINAVLQTSAGDRGTLRLGGWPENVRPLAAHSGPLRFCRISPLEADLDTGLSHRASQSPFETAASPQLAEVQTLAAKGRDEDDEEGEQFDQEPPSENEIQGRIEWRPETGILQVTAEVEEGTDPGLICVELEWTDEFGDRIRRLEYINLDQYEGDDFWSGFASIYLPESTKYGFIRATARSLEPEDLANLPADATPESVSPVVQWLAASRLPTHACNLDDEEDRQEGESAVEIYDVDQRCLPDGQIVVQVASTSTQHEQTLHDEAALSFEQSLRAFRDAGDDIDRKSREQLFRVLFASLYPRVAASKQFRSWPAETLDLALQRLANKIWSGKLPKKRLKENLTGWCHTVMYHLLCGLARLERSLDGNREVLGKDGPQLDQLAEVIDDAIDEDTQLFVNALTFEDLAEVFTENELHYWVLSKGLELSDTKIADRLETSWETVRTLKWSCRRKRNVLVGLQTLGSLALSPKVSIPWSDQEQLLVELAELKKWPLTNRPGSPGLFKSAGVSQKAGKELLRRATLRVELAAAIHEARVSENDLPVAVQWLSDIQPADFQVAPEVVSLARRLHGQLLVMNEPRRGRLMKRGRLFVKYRVLQRKSVPETNLRILDHKAEGAKTEVELLQLPEHVATKWNAYESLVPESLRTVTADELVGLVENGEAAE